MDGTLLNSNHMVSSRFFEVFKKLQQKNILFVAASGRPYYSIIEKLQPIKDVITVVAENGGLVIQDNSVLLSNTINPEKLAELYGLVTTIDNTYPIFCTKNRAYILEAPGNLIHIFSEYYSVYSVIDSLTEIKDDVIKIALYHPTNSEAHVFPSVKHLKPGLNVVVSGNHWVDISDSNTNKGNAITLLQDHHGITPAETMAFGDYNNDIELLKRAKFSYAMANAHPDVKAVASYNTTSNDNYGVEQVLERLISIHR